MSASPRTHHLDLRGMEPPEPLEKVLDALETLVPGERLCMLIEREPRPLYRILVNNGYAYKTECTAGLPYEVTIWHAPVLDALDD